MAAAILTPKNYARITGIALAATAVLGIVLSTMGTDGKYGLFCNEPSETTCKGDAAEKSFLGFDWTHNIVHVVLAVIALAVGFATVPGNYVRLYAIVFGLVYTALGAVGFGVADLGILHLELGENLVHLVIGLYGIVAYFMGTTTATTTTAATPAGQKRM